jgi:cellulose synthase/poly-beta-1,6-N-acetylglucosamine synthase-like glycosyltransferase
MKFQIQYPDAQVGDQFEFEYSRIAKVATIGPCRWCGSMTKWSDIQFQQPVCSEECGGAMWKQYREHEAQNSSFEKFDAYQEKVKEELKIAEDAMTWIVDILIVVRDQLEYFKECIESIEANTVSDYHLYIWDNASGQETKDYINELLMRSPHSEKTISVLGSNTNTGFIQPNNELAKKGFGEFIILINSDCKVFQGWDKVMTGFLDEHPDVAQVGYWGGHLGPDGRGFGGDNGYEVDYIPGWCFCISREVYEQYGLFDDEHLTFAYAEDADLSLRLKQYGFKIYSLHAPLVHHYQNKTIKVVEQEGEVDVRATFEHNRAWMQERWKGYLETERVLLVRNDESQSIAG